MSKELSLHLAAFFVGGRRMFVQCFVHECIGAPIVFARDMHEDDVGKFLCDLPDFFHHRLKRRHFHAVLAVQLLHDQFGIQVADEPARLIIECDFESFDERPVFGDVVGFDADALSMLLERNALRGVHEHASDRRLARVPARAAVGIQMQRAADVLRQRPFAFFRERLFDRIHDKSLPVSLIREHLLESPFKGRGKAEYGDYSTLDSNSLAKTENCRRWFHALSAASPTAWTMDSPGNMLSCTPGTAR